jgi:prolipoprotein diacylglyceryl transferase
MFINNLEPILFHWGLITIRWYGLLLACGVISALLILLKLFKQSKYSVALLFDLFTWLIIGGLVGARLGEVLFYNPSFYFSHPLEIIFINHGGLSSHGMTLGILATFALYYKIKRIDIRKYIDTIVISIPLLASFIRIGNYFNSEILGTPTNFAWGVWFQRVDGSELYRHPVQIYESLTTLGLFFVLYFVYKKYKNRVPQYFFLNLFFITYFFARFILEFFKARQGIDDTSLLTAGQILSIPFIAVGILYFISYFRKRRRIVTT